MYRIKAFLIISFSCLILIGCIKTIEDAVRFNNVEKVAGFIKGGEKIDKKDGLGYTLLHLAVLHGSYDVGKFLIDNGANVNIKDGSKDTPLHYAAEKGNQKFIILLIDNGAKLYDKNVLRDTPIHSAVRTNQSDAIELLLQKGVDVNARGLLGMTPLHLAVQKNNYDIVMLLVKRKADINILDEIDYTPLMHVIQLMPSNNIKIAEFLLEQGAEVNYKRKDGLSALKIALKKKNKPLIELLKKYGAKEE